MLLNRKLLNKRNKYKIRTRLTKFKIIKLNRIIKKLYKKYKKTTKKNNKYKTHHNKQYMIHKNKLINNLNYKVLIYNKMFKLKKKKK